MFNPMMYQPEMEPRAHHFMGHIMRPQKIISMTNEIEGQKVFRTNQTIPRLPQKQESFAAEPVPNPVKQYLAKLT